MYKTRRQEKKQAKIHAVRRDLDVRDKWLGIKRMKSTYKATPITFRDRHNRSIPYQRRAHVAAEYLAYNHWTTSPNSQNYQFPTSPIHSDSLTFDTSSFQMHELTAVIKKLKRRKAPGPDGIPLELFKELSEEFLEPILDLLNSWWNNTDIPPEALQARVVLIFKKRRQA